MSSAVLVAQATVLAHGGGAPEALTISVPIVVLAIFAVMEWRARARERAQDRDDD